MINYYDNNRFINKRTLAQLAGVSPRTFQRYLQSRRHVLEAMGIAPQAQKLPPIAVQYVCEDYCIDLPQELQDQQVLSKSTIYQHFIHALQNSKLERTLENLSKNIAKSDKVGQPNIAV